MFSTDNAKDEVLEKIYVRLPNHWATNGESFWATPLGNKLFRIENIPFYAYGLNFHDIVRATSDRDEHIPEIRALIETSGHRTFRVYFKEFISRRKQEKTLDSMKGLAISYERANETYFSLDLQPAGDYQRVFDKLNELLDSGILSFETCEARVEGSFDDLPNR